MKYTLCGFNDGYLTFSYEDGAAYKVDFKTYMMTYRNSTVTRMIDSYFYCWEAT